MQDMTGFRTLDRFRGQSQPKISVSVSLQKTTYPNQFSMRNTNLESKIARHQLFDLKVTFWPDMPKYRVKINVTFSLHKPTYPGQFFMRNSNLELKMAWDQLFDLKVTFWPDLSKCRVKINVAFSLQKKTKTTYPGQFFMRNSNLKSKIARDQLFDLKVTFWPDIPTSGQVNIRSKCMFSFCYKTNLPGPVLHEEFEYEI